MRLIKKFWMFFGLLPLFLTCNKADHYELLGPGIVLSTDVQPQYWFDLKDYLKSKNAKVTFYMQSYHVMDSISKAKMKLLMADGHEMAHHTATHPHADEYLLSNTIDDYMQNEIFSMDSLMALDGMYTETFAYPYGDFTEQTDRFLLKRFKSIRKIISPYAFKKLEDIDQIYYRYKGVRVFYGCTLDKSGQIPLKEIFNALDKAKNSKQTISLYCHFINKGQSELPNQLSLDYEKFKAIIEYSNKIGLRFYTATEISR